MAFPRLAEILPGACPNCPAHSPSPRRSPIFARDREALLVELDGLPRLAEILPGDAQIAQRVALAVPIAELTRDREALLVELDRLARLRRDPSRRCPVPARLPSPRRSAECPASGYGGGRAKRSGRGSAAGYAGHRPQRSYIRSAGMGPRRHARRDAWPTMLARPRCSSAPRRTRQGRQAHCCHPTNRGRWLGPGPHNSVPHAGFQLQAQSGVQPFSRRRPNQIVQPVAVGLRLEARPASATPTDRAIRPPPPGGTPHRRRSVRPEGRREHRKLSPRRARVESSSSRSATLRFSVARTSRPAAAPSVVEAVVLPGEERKVVATFRPARVFR